MSINNRKNSLYNPKFKQERNKPFEKEEVKNNKIEEQVNEEIKEEIIENIEQVEEKNTDKIQQIEKEMQLISENIYSGEITTQSMDGEESKESEIFTEEQILDLQFAMSEKKEEDVKQQQKQNDEIYKKTIPHYNITKNPLTNSIDVVSPKKIKKEEVVQMSPEKNDVVRTMLEQASLDIIKMEIEIDVHKNLITLEHLHTSRNELQNKLSTFMRNHEYLVKRKEQLSSMLDNSSQ